MELEYGGMEESDAIPSSLLNVTCVLAALLLVAIYTLGLMNALLALVYLWIAKLRAYGSYLPPVTEDDINRFKNKKGIDEVLPFAFTTVVEWGCNKLPNKTYWEYINNPSLNKVKHKRPQNWNKAEEEWLRVNKCCSCDVTLLSKLIPEICEGIQRVGDIKGSGGDTSRIEFHLKKAKDIRNKVCHDPKHSAVRPDILMDIQQVAIQIVKLAAKMYSEDSSKKIKEIKRMIKEINETVMNDEQKRDIQYSKKICIDGKREMKDRIKREQTDVLPFSHTRVSLNDVFHHSKLTIMDSDRRVTNDVPCDKIFMNADIKFRFVEGQPGAGKTTLLKRLRDDFISEGLPEIFERIRNFPFLLYMACKETTVNSCSQLLKRNFPKMLEHIPVDKAVELIRKMGVLICIDGVDEKNPKSEKLLNELIDFFGVFGSATFVVTSRPGASDGLKKLLDKKGISHLTATLQPISSREEQVEFLERYKKNIPEISSRNLIEDFISLGESSNTHFEYPVYLALFCHLYQIYPGQFAKWGNECNIMDQALRLSKDMMMERMDSKQKNPKHVAEKVMSAVNDLSIRQLLQDKMTISEEAYDTLCGEILKVGNIDCGSVLSCLFVSRPGDGGYEYLHKSHAEFMAARAITTRIAKNPQESIIQLMKEFTGREMTERDRERLLNVFRFVIMILIENGNAEEVRYYLNEICEFLGKEPVAFAFWSDLTLSCPSMEDVANVAAKGAVMNGNWKLVNVRQVTAASSMVRYHQPTVLEVNLSGSQGTPSNHLESLMDTITEKFTGELQLKLEHSYKSYFPVDKSWENLRDSGFHLAFFEGCLGNSRGAVEALASAVRRFKRVVKLRISLAFPRQHQLGELHDLYHRLEVRVQSNSEARLRNPLPRPKVPFEPPLLSVDCSADSTTEDLAALIEDLAPVDCRYDEVRLQNWHEDNNDQLPALLKRLRQSMIGTGDDGEPRWEAISYDRDGRCRLCAEFSHRSKKCCIRLSLPDRER